jgi:dTDP-4-dehydrorhamnose reductase
MPDKHMLELWGGFECSVVRIGSTFRNQAEETGHAGRPDDLDRAHALGIRTVRYPALWETIAPEHADRCEWRWHDERFERLRRLGMRPIVGLLHHGSGPSYTDLLDPSFPELLARHAERVARRYPWVEAWTPVNEPLTTARFSALYGHWYPHRTDTVDFLRATVHQCKATLLAMRAIRRITPKAQLIQTEDIGKTFSTPDLVDQAAFENGRRWLSLDLLCGRIDADHPWRGFLSSHGISDADLDLFLEGDAAPDIIGVNHYLTSERFLDRDWHRYPEQFRGGNGIQDYADVEAVRMALPAADLGPKARLRDVVERYGRPVAVTEVHHGCSREEQLRWLAEVWTAAAELKAEGADVRAVTVWSLVGTVDWNSLLTSQGGAYEPGAFDIRAPTPRRTALGTAVASLATSGSLAHPALGRGWWRRPERLYRTSALDDLSSDTMEARPLLITDGAEPLSHAFAHICEARGLPYVLMSEADSALEALEALRPWAVVNATQSGSSIRPEQDRDADPPMDLNEAEALASASARYGVPLVVFSSSLVFEGRRDRPSVEIDPVCPLGAPGAELAARERRVAAVHPGALVIRTGALFGPWDRTDVASAVLAASAAPAAPEGGRALPPARGLLSLTYLPDLAHATLDLLIDGETGFWHLVNPGRARRAAFASPPSSTPGASATGVAGLDGLDAARIPMASERAWIMPTLDDAMARFRRDCGVDQCVASARIAAE